MSAHSDGRRGRGKFRKNPATSISEAGMARVKPLDPVGLRVREFRPWNPAADPRYVLAMKRTREARECARSLTDSPSKPLE